MLYDPLENNYNHKNLVKANRERLYGSANYVQPDSLIKGGGEGSRGGKVIGHTKSGKAIYDSHDHPTHTSFSSKDHMEAAEHHHNLIESKLKDGVSKTGSFYKHHGEQIDKHLDSHSAKGANEEKNSPSDKSSVIGKTKSGKDIRNFPDHPDHKDFTADDHLDAFHAQKKLADNVKKKVFDKHGGSTKESREELDNDVDHGMASERMQKHLDHYGKLHGVKKDDESDLHPKAQEYYNDHKEKFSKMNDEQKKKYLAQVKSTHEVGSSMKGEKTEDAKHRFAAHAKFLKDNK